MSNKRQVSQPEQTPSLSGHYAGFASRFVAFVIDVVILSTTLVFLSWFANSVLDMMQLRPILKYLNGTTPVISTIWSYIISPLGASFISFLIILSYYMFFWTIAGQTIGKAIMGIRIVPLKGGKLSFARAFLRYSGYFVSAILLCTGFMWILIDDRRLAYHDKIARTCVIYAWDARPDERFLYAALKKVDSQRKALKILVKRKKHLGDLLEETPAKLPEETGALPAPDQNS
jgi:uncharacterized RDD family membrane protein YckC